MSSLRGKQLMDEVREAVTALALEQRRLLERRSNDAARTQRETIVAIGAGAVVMLVLLALSSRDP